MSLHLLRGWRHYNFDLVRRQRFAARKTPKISRTVQAEADESLLNDRHGIEGQAPVHFKYSEPSK